MSCHAKGGDDGQLYRQITPAKTWISNPAAPTFQNFLSTTVSHQDTDFDATSLDLSIMYFNR
jgi:hypothetical protein